MSGGGVGLNVCDSFSVEILSASDPVFDNATEFSICEIRQDQLRLLLAAVYRRPHASYPIYFFDCLATHLALYSSAIITGDFNINMALPDSPDAVHLHNSICSNSLQLIPSDPTHHQLWRGSYTWIDLFIAKSTDHVLTYRKSDAPFIAGHDFIEISLTGIEPPPIYKSVMLRDLMKVNPDLLRSILPLHLPPVDTHSLTSSHSYIATTNSSELVLGPCPAHPDIA